MLTAEYDPLRDEGLAYAAKLQEAGVTVRKVACLGQIHGFSAAAGPVPQSSQRHALGRRQAAAGDAQLAGLEPIEPDEPEVNLN